MRWVAHPPTSPEPGGATRAPRAPTRQQLLANMLQPHKLGHHAALMAMVRSRMAAPPAAPKPAGYWHSREYRRLQREREATAEGRVLRDYVAHADRGSVAAVRAAVRISEDGAKRIRRRFIRSLLKEFNRIASKVFPEVASDLRKEQAARARKDYQKNLVQERLRTAAFKAAHPETVRCYNETRIERIDATSDGTATKESVLEAKAAASRCAYCDCLFEEARKQTDHMVALCHGGDHSLRNIVIVCRPCNARKASLTYAQWIERVEPEHRVRVQRLWIARHPTSDRTLPLFAAYAGLWSVATAPAEGQAACM
jgi:5-methylcytosine-specific restriction endonuclease McrA